MEPRSNTPRQSKNNATPAEAISARRAVDALTAGHDPGDLAATGRWCATLQSLQESFAKCGADQAARTRVLEIPAERIPGLQDLLDLPAPLALWKASVTADQLLGMDVPVPRTLLGPITEGSLSMLYAPTGVGKSLLAYEMAWSIASGISMLDTGRKTAPPRWEPGERCDAAIIDGEMPLSELKKRVAWQKQGRSGDTLHLLTNDRTWQLYRQQVRLYTPDGRAMVDEYINTIPGLRFLVLDNVGSLLTGMDEDSKHDLEPINDWLMGLRNRRIAVLQVHHTGKGGAQRGTSYREDPLDLVMRIDPLIDPEDGGPAHFNVLFTKSRIKRDFTTEGFNARFDNGEWSFRSLTETRVDELVRIVELTGKFVANDLCIEMNVKRSRLYALRRKAEDQGKWKPEWGSTGRAKRGDRLLRNADRFN